MFSMYVGGVNVKAEDLILAAQRLTENSPGNYVDGNAALNPKYVGMRIFEAPIFAFGSADDPLFTELQSSTVVGKHFMMPHDWLKGATTVISFFLPFTDCIKDANAKDFTWPAEEWLHGRIEGQLFVRELTVHLLTLLNEAGATALAPSLDTRMKSGIEGNRFTSNWSERHVAYLCGLGTFGLSRGIITAKGMAGRLSSILTDLTFPYTSRPYNSYDAYCTKCGACISHCPVDAISMERGKEHKPCSDFLDEVRAKHEPRYGCGKCQVQVPCASQIPIR